MELGDVLDLLSSSELANLSVVQDGEINPEKIPKIVNAINLGLVKLYTRFKLKQNTLAFRTISTKNVYEFTSSNIKDLNNPSGFIETQDFSSDIIEILALKTEENISISVEDFDSVFLLKSNTLKFISPTDALYTLEYSALPSKVVYTNALNVAIDLPETYLQALLYFIGSRFSSPVGVSFDANRNSMDVAYMQQYENECRFLETKGLDVGNNIGLNLFYGKGFI